ncbi:single-stranded DNA-binding protein [Nocardioides marmoriginsengisoli]|uniref:Single-stranded DNA-binding protein n=1 Tax=Nocardioides marmoriginsengisoli TaxID=661483 RepID=A0A3N0CIC0_9ACTN|nr:single-stranded DNA-binding protein [Nocardioides marmoriginsengisoli]RNL63175.1 single-stranded DNA-binding protein [Nocardioides marmoriginsengisoli]
MNETYVTLQGWVGNEVDVRDVGDTQCASFRVGCTPRYLKGGDWVEGQTSWYTVNCWRGLGRNVADSVRKGDAVVVHGRVRVDVWEREDQQASVSWLVDATFVGHDLSKGTSAFARSTRAPVAEQALDEGVRELVHSYDPVGPRLDSDGNALPDPGREPAA